MAEAKVEALVFDLGGVIVAHDDAYMHARLSRRCAPDADPDAIADLTREPRWETGAPISGLHAAMSERFGYRGDWPAFAADWCCHLKINPSMLAYVEALARGRRVMIFSNTNAEHWNFVVAAAEGRLNAFERHLSHELGLRKPHGDVYAAVARAAGLAPRSLLFFDDRPANVEAARRAGFQAELFVDEPTLRASLLARGLHVV